MPYLTLLAVRRNFARYLLWGLPILCLLPEACRPTDENRAEALLIRAAEAHGGLTSWERLDRLAFTKRTTLYREDGSVESSIEERQRFRWDPAFSATLSWREDGKNHRIEHAQDATRWTVDGTEVTDLSQVAAAQRRVEAALYTASQPFHLLPDLTHARHEGRDTLPGNQPVEVVRMDYPGENADTWWYYFDPENGRCVANLVFHAPTFALVHTLSFIEVGPLRLHGERETWRVDSLGKPLFLRASYLYENYSIKMKEPRSI